jgi:hypothetical protein
MIAKDIWLLKGLMQQPLSARDGALDAPSLPGQRRGKQIAPTAFSSSNRAPMVVLNVFS